MSRPQLVRVPWRVVTSGTYTDAAVSVYVKVSALARRREGCEAGVAYLAGLLGLGVSTVERALSQLSRPAPDDDVVELTRTRRTLPGGRGHTAVRRPRAAARSESFVWVPSRASEALSGRQLRAYAAVAYAVATGHPAAYAEIATILRHRTGKKAGQALDDRAVAAILDGLEDSGWISIERRAGYRGRHVYTVHHEPFHQLELPDGDGSGGDLGDGSLATEEDQQTDSPIAAQPGGSSRRRRPQVVARGPVENPPLPPAFQRAYAGPHLTLAPRIWKVLAPIAPLLPGLSRYVVRELAREVGSQLDQGQEPERLRGRLAARYATTDTIRDPGRWLLGAAVTRRGCGLAACESGRIWRTGARCEVCADVRSSRPPAPRQPQPPVPHPAGSHRYQPDRRGACARCDLPAANARHLEPR